MEEFTVERVEEMIREAVEKTERSFGGTFKRLKSENEEILGRFDAEREKHDAERAELERRLAEREEVLAERERRLAEIAVRAELNRQIASTGPIPERFIDAGAIPYSEDPEELKRAVTEALERGRAEFDAALREAGVAPGGGARTASNPTNPAVRDGSAGRDIKAAGARDALKDMSRRGLLRE